MDMSNLPRQDLQFLCRKNGLPAKTNIDMAEDLKDLEVIKGMAEFVSSPRGVPYRFSYKVVVVGESGVGKTTFLERFRQRKVRVDSTTNIYPIDFITNRGKITFDCWDSDKFMHGGQCAIIMFSILSKPSCRKISYWCRRCRQACGEEIPITVCCTKMYADQGIFRPEACYNFMRTRPDRSPDRSPDHFELVKVSSLANQNVEDVFSWLGINLTDDWDLTIDPASYQLAEPEAERFSD